MSNNIEIKEEGKVKTWIKKHKTGLVVGSTALVGFGSCMVMYILGFRDGRSFGCKEGVDFMESEVKLSKPV